MGDPNVANRTIWTGDNLDIMRGMNSACVDLIYLDPPFNSNRTYEAPVGSAAAGAAFKDSWTFSDLDAAWLGLIADQHPALYAVINAAGFARGKGMQSYLCMMAVRLLEMHRVLKPTGVLYFHCDPTASHYIKALLDGLFGHRNFQAEITWKRTSAHNDSKSWGQVKDTILFYSKSEQRSWNPLTVPHDEGYVRRFYRGEDKRGRFRLDHVIRTESMGERPNLVYQYDGYTPRWGWRMTRDKLETLDADGLLVWSKTGRPYRKRYLSAGQRPTNLWADIPNISGRSRERVGYPTQKPRALLERIISASSNAGDVVLDPFCGCATACVAAERLDRQWIGIDLSPRAADLVLQRLDGPEYGAMFRRAWVTVRTDIPTRTDIETPVNYRQRRHELFGRQEGRCRGCGHDFPFRNFTVDHVVPRSRGGTDDLANLQLLCGACNSLKGNRPHEYLVARLIEQGIVSAPHPSV